MGDTAGDPGARGVLLSVPLGIVAAVWLLGFAKLDVDDRGEPLPISNGNGFRGLYLATREALTGHEVTAQRELGVQAVGTFWLIMVVIPLLVVLGVFVFFRLRRAQSTYWTVTIGMLLIAATVLLLGRIEYIGSMAALTWASFQIRRAELPGKMADREAARAARAEAAAAAAAEQADDEYDEDDYDEDAEYEDEAYYEEDEDAEGEDGDADDDDTTEDDEAEDDEAEYDEEAYEDGDVDEDETDEAGDADEVDAETAADETGADDEVAVADDVDESAPDEDERIVDYDEDVLKELEAEIDESEGRDGDGATKPGR
jgi:hypothetical protein